MAKDEDYKYPVWVWIIFYILILLSLVGNPIFGLIHLAIFFLCKTYFEDWALEINKSPTIPFLLVTLFGLLGQLGYYIYYSSQKNEKNKD